MVNLSSKEGLELMSKFAWYVLASHQDHREVLAALRRPHLWWECLTSGKSAETSQKAISPSHPSDRSPGMIGSKGSPEQVCLPPRDRKRWSHF